MKTAVILGAGQMGRAVCGLLAPNNIRVAAFGDNDPNTHDADAAIPVLPVEEALGCGPDLVVVAVMGAERAGGLRAQLGALGYTGETLLLGELYALFDIRSATLKRLAGRMRQAGVPGAVAELGVYKGDFAWQLNEQFFDRKLYLFDTFAGFDEQDVAAEHRQGASGARARDFCDTRAEDVLARMPHKERVVLLAGRFPGTAKGLEERFALVSIDADLYAPTLAGLAYFYPRLSPGGAILLHDYNNTRFGGVRRAVEDFEAEQGALALVPLGDLHGTAVIMRG